MWCPPCGRGFHDECEVGCISCHPNLDSLAQSITRLGNRGEIGQPTKNPEDVRDRHSTGRKRAAQLYPLFRNQACEWQGKKNCGGGKNPIVGCSKGLQQHRHHGPLKDTLRNEPGNVHRICNPCHTHWHATNDTTYDEEENKLLPHSPEPADEIELLANEAYWAVKR